MEFTEPIINYTEIIPLMIALGIAVAGVLVEAFVPRGMRRSVQITLALAGMLAVFGTTVIVATGLDATGDGVARGVLAGGATLAIDGPTVFLWGVISLLALGGVALFAERKVEAGVSVFAGQAAALPGTEAERVAAAKGVEHTEVYPLLVFATLGMLMFVAANDLLTMFVALEVLSLPLYLLCGLARRRRLLSQEAAMKYFLLGAFSSGFFLYGVALTYGFAGSMEFGLINEAVRNDTGNRTLLLIGIGMLAVGLLFKVGAVPFQSWTPDVYQGAPTAVTAFMAAATKVAAFGAIMRLFYVAFGADRWNWQPMMWVIAILTMLVGAVLAVVQSDVKRMLAYSSIAHTGFILTGTLGLQSASDLAVGQITSLQAVLFYLATYGLTTLGAFAICSLVRDASGEVGLLDKWAGLGRTSPVVAGAFAFLLLAMAGIPLTSGFVGKWSVFTVAMSAGAWPVVLVGIASSVISIFFYVRVIRLMFFSEPAADNQTSVTMPSLPTTVTIAVAVVATFALGIIPGPLLDLAANAGEFIR